MFNIDMEGIDLEKTYDLIVIGGGPTAIGSAIYAARFAVLSMPLDLHWMY